MSSGVPPGGRRARKLIDEGPRQFGPVPFKEVVSATWSGETVVAEAIIMALQAVGVVLTGIFLFVLFLLRDFVYGGGGGIIALYCILSAGASLVASIYLNWTRVYLALMAGVCLLIAIQQPIRAAFSDGSNVSDDVDVLLVTELLALTTVPLVVILVYAVVRFFSHLFETYFIVCRKMAMKDRYIARESHVGGVNHLLHALVPHFYVALPLLLPLMPALAGWYGGSSSNTKVLSDLGWIVVYYAILGYLYLPMALTVAALTDRQDPLTPLAGIGKCFGDYFAVLSIMLVPAAGTIGLSYLAGDFVAARFDWTTGRLPIALGTGFILGQFVASAMAGMLGLVARKHDATLRWFDWDQHLNRRNQREEAMKAARAAGRSLTIRDLQ